ncbi:TIR domain-containing protein [Caminibacter sp.]
MKLNIYYSKNLENKQKFENFFIYNYLFKDKNNYLAGELIDVRFYNIKDFEIKYDFCVILVDDYLIDEIYDNQEINNKLKEKWEYNDKSIIFVALSENFNQLEIAKEVNFVRAYDKDDLFEFLFIEITHDILRFLLKEEKLNIFISHAKSDGKNIAKAIKEFIDSDLKLSNFFDEVDIQNSQKWDDKLEKSIKKSLFLYILSDNYAQTLWTKKEIIFARKNKRPIVGIDVLSNKNEIFQFISNTPILKLKQNIQAIEVNCKNSYLLHTKSNIRKIINLLLKEALMFELVKNKTDLPKKPDFFDLLQEDKNTIIYPDPPIMNIEKNELQSLTKKNILTILESKFNKTIKKRIAVSISESNDLEEKGMRIEHLNLLMIEIARYLIILGAELIYGGDLGYKKEFNFTSILAETFRAYNNLEENQNKHKKLINYSAYPFCERIDIKLKNKNKDVIDFKPCIGEKCDFDDIEKISNNLTQMREIITKEMNIKIAVGGKITGFSGFYPGVLEEIYLALKSKKRVILIEGFGGIVDKIVEFLRGNKVEELIFEYQKIKNDKLRNFLTKHKEKELEIKTTYNCILETLIRESKYITILKFETYEQIIEELIIIV